MKQRGFSLIELMITVAILGIIVAIAYPSYTQYVQDARRAEAQGAMVEAAQWMERQFTVDGSYPEIIPFKDSDDESAGKIFDTEFYDVSLTNDSDAATYTVQGERIDPDPNDTTCDTVTLTLTSIGEKSVVDSKGDDVELDCW